MTHKHTKSRPGTVYLVGAGPGDPALLTLRAVACLQRADTVLYDSLVDERVLRHARPGTAAICVGKHGAGRVWSQDEIQQRLIELAQDGQTVVRLKGGDPSIFGRGAEELETLRAHGVEYEIVPGITAAAALGAYAGLSLTHREFASAVALVTGQEAEKETASLDFAALARFPGTIVVYMGVTTAAAWVGSLIEHGKDAATPAVIVRRCSHPDQQTFWTTLGDVPRLLNEYHLRPPVMVVIGAVAMLTPGQSWFEQRPLFGRTVLVTRPRHQADELIEPLAEQGAAVVAQPAIQILPPDDWQPTDAAIAQLPETDWLVFSSVNGVQGFLERLLATGRDLRALGRVRLAAIGAATAAALEQYHLRVDVTPDQFHAEALAAKLTPQCRGQRFLLVRASRGREVLADELQRAGAIVRQVVVYQSVDVEQPDETVRAMMRASRIDWVTVTSSAIARSLHKLFGQDLYQARLASISPITTRTLNECGYPAAAEATVYTMPGLVEAIVQAESNSRRA